jgi:hypothetical protein
MKRIVIALIAAGLSTHLFAANQPVSASVVKVIPQSIGKPLDVQSQVSSQESIIVAETPSTTVDPQKIMSDKTDLPVGDVTKSRTPDQNAVIVTKAQASLINISPDSPRYIFEVSLAEKDAKKSFSLSTLLKEPVTTTINDSPSLAFSEKEGINVASSDGVVKCDWNVKDSSGDSQHLSISNALGESTAITILPIEAGAENIKVSLSINHTVSHEKQIVKVSDTCFLVDGNKIQSSMSTVLNVNLEQTYDWTLSDGTIMTFKAVYVK